MYTEEQLSELEEKENSQTVEAILAMLLLVDASHGRLKKELRDFYQQYGKDGVVTYTEARKWVSNSDHRKRLLVLYDDISEIFGDLHLQLYEEFNILLKDIIDMESKFFDIEVEVDKILMTTWGVDELNWSDRLANDVELWLSKTINDIKLGILKRDPLDIVLENVDKRFVSIKKVLDSLGLTESTAMGSIARRNIFKKLGINRYGFYSRVDERRCEYCGSLHGKTFPITAYEVGVTASPIHPRCRCWEVPITD